MSVSVFARAAAAAALLALAGGPAAAQGGWSFNLAGYLWGTATTVTADTPFGQASTELSFSDAIQNLDFAFMGSVEARNGPWTIIGDLIYLDLGTDAAPPGPVFDTVFADVKTTVLSAYGLYRVYEDQGISLDVGGGLRGFSADLDITLVGATTRILRQGRDWVDPLLAARMRAAFGEQWFGALFLDFGGTGDTRSWQALATIGYALNDNWVFQGGWRYMEARWDTDFGRTKIEFSGPILGAVYRF